MHGLATGSESRQQLYTMMTRGRARQPRLPRGRRRRRPALGHPPDAGPAAHRRPTSSSRSWPATTPSGPRPAWPRAGRPGHPARRRPPSVPRRLYVAAEDLLRHGPRRRRRRHVNVVDALDNAVETLVPGCPTRPPGPPCAPTCCCSARPARTPSTALRAGRRRPGAGQRRDRAAVLDWRLDATGLAQRRTPARCRGCPRSRHRLAERPALGRLPRPARRPGRASSPTRSSTPTPAEQAALPAWAQQRHPRPRPPRVGRRRGLARRHAGPRDDRRPTGAPQLQKASGDAGSGASTAPSPATARRRSRNGGSCSTPLAPQVRDDEFTPLLAERLAAMSRAGVTAHELLRTAAAPDHPAGPLPDDHAAAALWWRMARHLTPAVAPRSATAPTGERHHRLGAAARGPVRSRARREHPGQHLVAGAGHQRRPRPAARLAGRGPAGRRPGAAERRLGGRRRVPGAGLADLDRAGDRSRRARARVPLRRAARGPVGGIEPDPAMFVDHARRHPVAACRRTPARTSSPGRPRRRAPGRRARGRDLVDVDEDQYVERDLHAGRLHPRPRRQPAGAHRRRHPAHVPARRRVALLPRHA